MSGKLSLKDFVERRPESAGILTAGRNGVEALQARLALEAPPRGPTHIDFARVERKGRFDHHTDSLAPSPGIERVGLPKCAVPHHAGPHRQLRQR
jgi:hypothetical protein